MEARHGLFRIKVNVLEMEDRSIVDRRSIVEDSRGSSLLCIVRLHFTCFDLVEGESFVEFR